MCAQSLKIIKNESFHKLYKCNLKPATSQPSQWNWNIA